MSPAERVAYAAGADFELEALVASWTGDSPGVAYRIDTRGSLRARDGLEAALRSGARAIVVTGASGHGKTTLLRSFWQRPPRGFAAIFVPPLDGSEPGPIAERILAETRSGAVHDAAGALSRLLRAHTLRGGVPVLLVDDLHDVPGDTLEALLGLAESSHVDVRVVAAGAPGRALDDHQRAMPRPARRIVLADPWTRADAERLIARIGAALPTGVADLLAAIDVGEVLRSSEGNPRLVHAALAAQLRQLNLPAVEPVIAPPEMAAPIEPAISEPVTPVAPEPAAELPPAPIAAPHDARPSAPPRPPPVRAVPRAPRAARSRAGGRRRLTPRTARRIAAGLAAAVALAVLVDRAPEIASWSAETAGAYAAAVRADTTRWTGELTARISAGGRTVSEAVRSFSGAVSEAVDTVSAASRDWLERTPSPPAPPPIRVAVNSDPWSHVEVDGVAAGPTPLVIEIAPGPHRFRAVMADGRTVEREIEIAVDRNRVVLGDGVN